MFHYEPFPLSSSIPQGVRVRTAVHGFSNQSPAAQHVGSLQPRASGFPLNQPAHIKCVSTVFSRGETLRQIPPIVWLTTGEDE